MSRPVEAIKMLVLQTVCVCVCVCVAAQKAALIVFAHQSQGSFNAAARDVAVQALTDQGFNVTVSDLYAMNFRASATPDDIIGESVILLHVHLCDAQLVSKSVKTY